MRLNDIVKFANLLGIDEVKVSEDDEWARMSCPLAPITHVKGTDENPSFGIKVNDEGESGFHCFSCKSGRLYDLVHIMNFTTGISQDACSFFGSREVFDEENREEAEFAFRYRDLYSKPLKKVYEKNPIPDSILESIPLLESNKWRHPKKRALKFMADKGISEEVLYRYGTRLSPQEGLICFPLIDTDGKIYRLHQRVIGEKTFWHLTPKIAGSDEKWGSKDTLYGLQFYDPYKPLILVESQTDLLKLVTLGVDKNYSILATCGTPNKPKLSRINNSRIIYSGFDADPAGRNFHGKFLNLINFNEHTVFRLDWSLVHVKRYTKKKRIEKSRPANDAGDLETIEQFEEVVRRKITLGQAFQSNISYKDIWG